MHQASNTKRTRRVLQKPTSDYCRTCRDRKLKCDGTRPSCQRCKAAGRLCGGYATWPVQLNVSYEAVAVTPLPKTMEQGPQYRMQLLADFEDRYSPQTVLAAPCLAHMRALSFISTLLKTHVSSDLLKAAMETLSLAHMASNEPDLQPLNALLQQSYCRLLPKLREALAVRKTSHPHQEERDVLATMVTLSVIPLQLDGQQKVHLLSAAEYLAEKGPSILAIEDQFDRSVLLHIHLYLGYSSVARRRRSFRTGSTWRNVPRTFVHPALEFPSNSRHIPGLQGEADFVIIKIHDNDVVYFNTLTGLLEEADRFVLSENRASAQDINNYEQLVRDLDELQCNSYSIEPMSQQEAARKIRIVGAHDANMFKLNIEEHAFIYSNDTFADQYQFLDQAQGFRAASRHWFTLLMDCAILQLMYSAYIEKGIFPSAAHIRMIDVERRAYWHASELCRCAFFYSQRSLTAARLLYALICSARNFFESYGAAAELDWCNGCLFATQLRIERLRSTTEPTLCRLEDVAAGLARGCSYGRRWTEACRRSEESARK